MGGQIIIELYVRIAGNGQGVPAGRQLRCRDIDINRFRPRDQLTALQLLAVQADLERSLSAQLRLAEQEVGQGQDGIAGLIGGAPTFLPVPPA